MRILMIIAPRDETSSLPTIGQVVEPYYQFRDSGAEVVLASPDGGAPVATASLADVKGPSLRFRADYQAREAFTDTLRLEQVFAEDFDAAYCIGFSEQIARASNQPIAVLVDKLFALGKPVALVSDCRGAGLMITGSSPRSAALALISVIIPMGQELE